MVVGNLCQPCKIRNVQAGIPNGFHIDGTGIIVNLAFKCFRLVFFHKFDLNAGAW